jgi:L-aspartate oxidase
VHAGGDATGAEIERALVAAVRATAVGVHERTFVTDLLVEHGVVVGARAVGPDGTRHDLRARHTMLATGGAGQCFAVTTNPRLSTGDGIAMAARAGAAIADLEFMQFHPTALDHPAMPRPLLSEALRGEGAVLRDADGVAFMASVHPMADLAPRDVVARAITERIVAGDTMHLWLDATGIPEFPTRFPTVFDACQGAGLDPRREWLPVAPAAHYLSGGIATDLDGASSLPGLWACGEVACSGVHGANRLASNSLLDGLVFGPRAVEAIAAGKAGPDPTGVLRSVSDLPAVASEPDVPTEAAPTVPTATEAGRQMLQRTMTRDAGVLRNAAGLLAAQHVIAELDAQFPPTPTFDPAYEEVRNLIAVSERLIRAATLRAESRGTHTRTDEPDPDPAFLGRFVHVGGSCGFHPLPEREVV